MEQNTPSLYDVVVIGGGPGGYATALYGASAGLKIALIEKDKVGGTCLHRGCIPAKELLESAAVRRAVKHAADFGIHAEETGIDWNVTIDRKQKVIDTMFGGLSSIIKGRKIDVYNGVGLLGPSHQVEVANADGTTATLLGTAIVIATGSVPRTIPGFEPDGKVVFTSDEFLDLRTLPSTAAVIGGGAIGCEFASTLADMGVKVTILEGLPKILPGCDKDAAQVVERAFKKKGMDIRTGVSVTGHTPKAEGGTTIDLGEGGTLDVDIVVVSVGRKPVSSGVVPDGTAVQIDERGFYVVDANCRTAEPGVWAVGDCIATPQLAHIGFIEGINTVKDILGENPAPVDYSKVPWAIYCHPEVAFAGHSEESAKEAGYDVVVSKHRFVSNGRAQILGDTDGLVKVIAEKKPDGNGGKILGVHMVGPWVTEQLGQGYLAVNWEATVDEVAELIQPHPSLSELFGETVIGLTGRSLH
ncbi:MAG: dihydrolipoyl dehydrogenase [Actinobacteria bacterium]|nr:dihydrolipoyl dehydrogenase [Actinomycetota bacterium]